MEHTKEPWHTDNNFRVRDMGHIAAVAQDGRAVALTGFAGAGDEQESIANASRIVACVNACARIPTEVLEAAKDGAALIDLVQSAAELKQQRDHLESENAKQAELLNKVIEQRDELLKDAERYRWLRDNSAYVGVNPHAKTCLWVLRGIYEIEGEGFDSAIDAAIAKVKEQK